MRHQVQWSVRLVLLACALPGAVHAQEKQKLESDFQAAVAQYDAGHFPQAATQLESLERKIPDNFEVQELLGLAYSAQSQDDKARPHFEKAVRLKPNSAPARTTFATNLT